MTKSVASSPATPGATRGRPLKAAAVDVRLAILSVAEERIAEQGYAATSVREIADLAGVNPAMIHYYFGNKESLLRAVLEEALKPLASAIEAMKLADSVSPEEITRTLMETVARHPKLPFLVVREVMLPGGVMQSHFSKHLAPRLGGALPALLEREQEAGRIRGDLPPAAAAMALMALAMFPFIVRPVAEKVLGLELEGQALEEFRDHIASIVKRGFKP